MVYFHHILHTYACQHSLITGMQEQPVIGDSQQATVYNGSLITANEHMILMYS